MQELGLQLVLPHSGSRTPHQLNVRCPVTTAQVMQDQGRNSRATMIVNAPRLTHAFTIPWPPILLTYSMIVTSSAVFFCRAGHTMKHHVRLHALTSLSPMHPSLCSQSEAWPLIAQQSQSATAPHNCPTSKGSAMAATRVSSHTHCAAFCQGLKQLGLHHLQHLNAKAHSLTRAHKATQEQRIRQGQQREESMDE